MLRLYSKLLEAYPHTTKISTTGILFWLGDLAA